MEINYNLVPLEVREWIQTFSLSMPRGVGVYVASGTALDLYRDKEPEWIDIWVTGAEILQNQKDIDNEKEIYTTFLEKLKQKNGLKIDDRYIISDTCDVIYCEVKEKRIKLFLAAPIMAFYNLIEEFDFRVCRMWVDDINTTKWELGATEEAIQDYKNNMLILDKNEKEKQVFDCDTTLSRQLRIGEYRKKFPTFKVYKEM